MSVGQSVRLKFAEPFPMMTLRPFLDGKEFRGTMRSIDAFPVDDIVSFRDGKFRSRYLLLHGFPEIPYAASLEKEASEAERLIVGLRANNNNAKEQLLVQAAIEGNDIDVQMEITREGEAPEYLHFGGRCEDIRVGYRSLAG
jgi:hypothetical protein